MVIAEVDTTVITYSELLAETRLVLVRSGGPRLALAQSLSKPLVLAVLRAMVHRELLLAEMRRLQLGKAPEDGVLDALSSVRRRFATDGDYLRFLERAGFAELGAEDLAPQSLLAILRAEQQVDRFLDIRIRLAAVISEADLYACYQANAARFSGRSFAQVQDLLRNTLQAQREREALKSLVEQLARRARIQYAKGYEPGPLQEEPSALRCPK